MKKDVQLAMNEYVLENLDKFIMDAQANETIARQIPKRLLNCQAYVFESDNYIILESYRTIVAFIDKRTMQKFDFLRRVYVYTATSAKHISKFFNAFGDCRMMIYTYRDI